VAPYGPTWAHMVPYAQMVPYGPDGPYGPISSHVAQNFGSHMGRMAHMDPYIGNPYGPIWATGPLGGALKDFVDQKLGFPFTNLYFIT